MQQQELRELLRRYAAGTCTKQERKLFEDLVLRKPLRGEWNWNSEEERILMGIRIKQSIDQQRLAKRRKQGMTRRLWQMGVAASILIAFGIAILWVYQTGEKTDTKQLAINESVPYSSDGITLVLSDGSEVNLDDYENGLVQRRGGLAIKKTADGQLIYEHYTESGQTNSDGISIAQNTIRVPNGKQFQLKLPDGTKVWMNTASSLTYPIAFVNGERKVTLNGEAYFEVAHDATKPFKVIANGTEIVVTGTHFNVSAYASDKTVTTTLLEGGVNIWKGGKHVSLTPGYQAITFDSETPINKSKSNLEQAMAWKNGYFMFDNMDLISIMRSVARWYDIRVTVDGDIPPKKFGGTFPVSADLEELLNDLSTLTNVKFHKEGKEVRIIW